MAREVTMRVRLEDTAPVAAILRAAGDLVVNATREPEDQPVGTSLCGTQHLDALTDALRHAAR